MIKINTRDFGELEVSEEQIYEFPVGVFAFEEVRKFALISPLGDNIYPMWLQCIDELTPCFIVFDPTLIDMHYQTYLSDNEMETLKLNHDSKKRHLVIAKVPSNFRETTVNMKSPIIINEDEKIGMQVILPQDYQFRLPIYSGNETEEGAS